MYETVDKNTERKMRLKMTFISSECVFLVLTSVKNEVWDVDWLLESEALCVTGLVQLDMHQLQLLDLSSAPYWSQELQYDIQSTKEKKNI